MLARRRGAVGSAARNGEEQKMLRKLKVRRWTVVAVGAVLALAGAGMAYASIPDSDGAFHACVSNSGGSIRMIDPSQAGSAGHCVDGENQVSWNKSGQKGARGPK